MPGQGRLGDKANVPLDTHGCPACPHPAAIGPAIQGSPDVNVNRRPALRVDDPGVHAACCGTNTWTATQGSMTVFINGKGAHRIGDQNRHCGGIGQLVEGSPNVIVGESNGGGTGGSTATGGSSGAAGNAGPSQRNESPSTSASGPAAEVRSNSNRPPSSARPGASGLEVPGSVTTTTRSEVRRSEITDEHQVEVQLVNVRGEPQGDVRFELTLPSGEVKTGTSAADGYIRISGLPQAGEAKLVLPELDEPVPE